MKDSWSAAVEELLAGPHPLPLVYAGDPVLRQPAEPLDQQLDSDLLAGLIEAMREAMCAAPGVGLAAPQIGIGLQIAVIEDPADVPAEFAEARERRPVPFEVIINPRYTPLGTRRAAFFEGCLSVPGYQAVVDRPAAVRLDRLDQHLEVQSSEYVGWPARIVQHETDHLAGTLYLDRAEIRSLTTNESYTDRWAEPSIEPARDALGF